MRAVQMRYIIDKALGRRVPGLPPHRFIQGAFYRKTFDNAKIEKALGFKAKISVVEAVQRICDLHVAERKLQGGGSAWYFSLLGVAFRSVVVPALCVIVASSMQRKLS